MQPTFVLGSSVVREVEESHEVLVFVVRLWRETHAGGQVCWRGRVENVRSQEVGYVNDVAGVARFMECWTMRMEERTPEEQ